MSSKRLIVEQDVLEMKVGEVLHLDPFTIITPSALDAAFRRGIPVEREQEGTPFRPKKGASAKKNPCLWHRILDTDGTYVVQVVNGVAQVNRLTETGPVPFGTDSAEEHNR
jgi:hypothetical protein